MMARLPSGFLYAGVLAALLLLAGCSKFTRIQKNPDLDLRYNAAMEYFDKKDYFRAGLLFEELMPLLKGTERAEKSQYYYGYCQFYEKQYELAAFYFERFYQDFPRSEFAPDAAYMEALSYFEDSPDYDLDQTATSKAMTALQNYLTRYPNTDRLEDCNFMYDRMRAKLERKSYEKANLYMRKQDYKAAIISLDNFRKDFPESSMAERAMAQRVEAAYRYARISVPSKQADRYQYVIELSQSFRERFPESPDLRQVTNYAENAAEALGRPGLTLNDSTRTDLAEPRSAIRQP